MSKAKLNQAGDTIIEVLLAVAVVSSVLGGSYVVVRKTTHNAQQAQEHTEALNYAQSQLERLRSAAQKNENLTSTELFRTTPYCLDSTGTIFAVGGSVLPATVASYPNQCKTGPDRLYRAGIIQRSPNLFDVYVTWDGPTGITEQVQLTYRMYQ